MNNKIFLPGTDKQIKILLNRIVVNNFTILIIGSGSEEISKQFLSAGASKIIIIVQDEDSLLITRFNLSGTNEVSVRLMDFDNTEFKDSTFDIVYAQASVSAFNRNKIIKEIKRILKPTGYFCIGEIISLTISPPQFVKDIWSGSNISPLYSEEINKYYTDKNFEIVYENDLSFTLRDFYRLSSSLLKEKSNELSKDEKSYYKKSLKQISHESNAYLKMGGNLHMGYKTLLLKKV
jgi:SAM-dependent methyltransferase